ncbi:MAG: thermonuclease family protein [Planctomycetota bacterium]|jgi:micrococcal nuclease
MSRRRKTGILILCLLPVALFIWLDHSLTRHKPQAQPESDEQAKAYDFQKYHTKTFTVVNVVDGDTVDVDVPDGEYKYTRIRLWGIDTPETKSDEFGVMYFGPQAAEFTIKLTFGKPVTLYLDVDNSTRDKFERLLAYVQLPDGGYLNEVLVAEGFAYADLRFRHSFYNKYRQLEAGARSGQKGLWQKVTREQLPEWLQREKPNLLNK